MGICVPPLGTIQGTGFNKVQVPDAPNSAYKSIAEELLYEIWQTNLLILAANPPAMSQVISFRVGDGLAGSPVDGDTELHLAAIQGQTIFNRQLLVVREGQGLEWSSSIEAFDIARFNTGGVGGFTFEGANIFEDGQRFNIYVIGINTTDNP